jgi:uncharacterized membrane protein YkoI
MYGAQLRNGSAEQLLDDSITVNEEEIMMFVKVSALAMLVVLSISAQDKSPAATQPAPRTLSEKTVQGVKNTFTQYRVEDLPAAVQKTVREQAGGQPIADVDRQDRTGQTVWEVEFEREGRNPRIHVANDGTLLPEKVDQFTPQSKPGAAPAAGRPAGTEVGPKERTNRGSHWGDLPQAVQQKAAQFGGESQVKDVDIKNRNGRNVYEVEFERSGRNLEVRFGEDGTILKSNDSKVAPAHGAAVGSESGSLIQPQPRVVQPPAQSTTQPQSNQKPINEPKP